MDTEKLLNTILSTLEGVDKSLERIENRAIPYDVMPDIVAQERTKLLGLMARVDAELNEG